MEKNNFNKAYIFIIIIFAIGIAISNIMSFFNGVGFALIGSGLLLTLAIVNIVKDEENKKRFGDIFVLITLEFIMLIVLFFAYDFNINGISSKFPFIIRNIYAIYSMFAIGYVIFRYVSEIKGIKYNFVEYMLGNYTPQPKEKKVKLSKEEIKKNRELENGTLEPKPSSIENAVVDQSKEVQTAIEDNEDIIGNVELKESTKEDVQTADTNGSESSVNTSNRTDIWY